MQSVFIITWCGSSWAKCNGCWLWKWSKRMLYWEEVSTKHWLVEAKYVRIARDYGWFEPMYSDADWLWRSSTKDQCETDQRVQLNPNRDKNSHICHGRRHRRWTRPCSVFFKSQVQNHLIYYAAYSLTNIDLVTVIYIVSLTNVDTLAKLESSRDSRERVSCRCLSVYAWDQNQIKGHATRWRSQLVTRSTAWLNRGASRRGCLLDCHI